MEPIYCLMITGKPGTIQFARTTAKLFLLQDYPNKHLIIINHDLTENVIFGNTVLEDKRINEMMVSKKNKTLGDLRNISLKYVPIGAYFYTYDSDDFSNINLLSYLHNEAKKNNAKYVLMRNRLNFNRNNDSLWRSSDDRGNSILFGLKTGENDFQYSSKDTLEDWGVKQLGNHAVIVNNPFHYYVRFVHENNTSPFVDPNQSEAKLNAGHYIEKPSEPDDYEYMKTFINHFSEC